MSKLARNAPSVKYPFGRSRVLGSFIFAVGLLGAGAVATWAFLGTRAGSLWPVAIACGLWLASIAGALHFWHGQPVGIVHWNGQSWEVALPDGPHRERSWALSAGPGVFLDMQTHLWVHVSPAGRQGLWLWLSRSSQPERWLDLRRAVYSRAKPGGGPDAIAPAGSHGA